MKDLEILVKIRETIKNGHLEEVESLIGKDTARRDMDTAFGSWLHVAASKGQLPIVKWLVEKAGIDINRKAGMFKGNALNEAASEGHLKIVRYLADKGAELDVSDPVRNPLFAAVLEGNLEIVKFLLERGIDPTVNYPGPTVKTHTAYSHAMKMGSRDIAAYIKEWIRTH